MDFQKLISDFIYLKMDSSYFYKIEELIKNTTPEYGETSIGNPKTTFVYSEMDITSWDNKNYYNVHFKKYKEHYLFYNTGSITNMSIDNKNLDILLSIINSLYRESKLDKLIS